MNVRYLVQGFFSRQNQSQTLSLLIVPLRPAPPGARGGGPPLFRGGGARGGSLLTTSPSSTSRASGNRTAALVLSDARSAAPRSSFALAMGLRPAPTGGLPSRAAAEERRNVYYPYPAGGGGEGSGTSGGGGTGGLPLLGGVFAGRRRDNNYRDDASVLRSARGPDATG